MARTKRQVIIDARDIERELARLLAKLETTGEGNSDLAWRIRDYARAVDRLASAMPASNETI